MVRLIVNDVVREFTDDPAMPLLWYVRDVLGLTGTKFGCGPGAGSESPASTRVRSAATMPGKQ
jgi:isoquinoline 1-oxidoreductase alpha subunit